MLIGTLVSACGGGGSSTPATTPPPPPASSYTIGGTIAGLTGSGLVLQDNGKDNLTVAANATSFTFATSIASGGAYAVTVATQPTNPAQVCTVSNGSGTVSSANVTNVGVTCTTNAYMVGVSISGLTGTGLVLQNNGGDNLSVAANATSASFVTPVQSGKPYAVTVLTQPTNPSQACTVTSGSGTVNGANVTVQVTCTTNAYTVGATISGLTGTGLVLQNNGGDNLAVPANATSATFATSLTNGQPYAVTVATQPSSPAETCTVSNGSGSVNGANVTVTVACAPASAGFTIGGTVTGLTGTGLVLQDNGGDDLSVAANATSFTFATALASGAAYAVTVKTQPTSPSQHCTVSAGTGMVAAANVTNVAINCAKQGQFAFVANKTDGAGSNGDVSAYTIDPTTGALTAVAGSPFAAHVNPTGVVVNPGGGFIYVADNGGGGSPDVTVFSVDPGTGVLTRGTQYGISNNSPNALAITPVTAAGTFVFTAGAGPGTPPGSLYPLVVNNDGSLTKNGPIVESGNVPEGIATSHAGDWVFATSVFEHHVYTYEISTSMATLGTPIAAASTPTSTGTSPWGVVTHPALNVVYVSNSGDSTISAFNYDDNSGALTEITGSPFASGDTPKGMAIDPAGKWLFSANSVDDTVSTFSIDQTTGALTAISPDVPVGKINVDPKPTPVAIAVDPSGQWVYAVNQLDHSVSLFTLNSTTGVLTLVGTYAAGTGAQAIAIW
jgi:6-phosphogluconolactonase (cycloisomerase 2 family)